MIKRPIGNPPSALKRVEDIVLASFIASERADARHKALEEVALYHRKKAGAYSVLATESLNSGNKELTKSYDNICKWHHNQSDAIIDLLRDVPPTRRARALSDLAENDADMIGEEGQP